MDLIPTFKMGRRRNKKKSQSESFPPAAPQNQPTDVEESAVLNADAFPVKADEVNTFPPESQPDSQYWSNNIGAGADAPQGVFSNLGNSQYSVASPEDVAVPPEHVNSLGMAPPGFNSQMQPMFMPSYGYPVMQDMSAFQPMSGAMYGDASYPCPFMNTGSSAVGSQDYQPGQADAFGGSALYGSPGGAESGAASTSAMPIGPQQANIAGAVNEAMMEDPAIILAQGSPQASVPMLGEDISEFEDLANQAIGECQEPEQMKPGNDSIDPNDCWADQVEEEMVELEQQVEAKKLLQKANAEKAEAAFMEKKGKAAPEPVAQAPHQPAKKSFENPAVIKEKQQEAEKLQEKLSAEKAEAAFVQAKEETRPETSKSEVDTNVAMDLVAETKKLQEKASAEKAETAFMEANEAAKADKEVAVKAVREELKEEGKKALEKVAAERAEAEYISEGQKSNEELNSAVVSDMTDLAKKTEAVKAADKAQAEHQAMAASKEVVESTKDLCDERLINEALRAEGERSQILMNAVHCEETYFERQSQQTAPATSPNESEAEKRSSPTEKKGMSWASVVADTSKEASPSPKERDPPKELSLDKTPSRSTPDRAIMKEKSPPKTSNDDETKEKIPTTSVEVETPADAAPASADPFADEDGFTEPRQARRNRRRKISRRSESELTDDEKTAQTPEEAVPAGSERATTRDENGNQLAGHRMNIIETDEVSTQTKNTTTSAVESQTEAVKAQDKPKIQEDKTKDRVQAELMQEKSQRMAGEGIIKMLETEAEQLRKQLASLQKDHVMMENDYVVAKVSERTLFDMSEISKILTVNLAMCIDHVGIIYIPLSILG